MQRRRRKRSPLGVLGSKTAGQAKGWVDGPVGGAASGKVQAIARVRDKADAGGQTLATGTVAGAAQEVGRDGVLCQQRRKQRSSRGVRRWYREKLDGTLFRAAGRVRLDAAVQN